MEQQDEKRNGLPRLASKSHKDKVACHTEISQESEVSQKNSDRDISLCAAHSAQYDNMDLTAFSKP